MQTIRYQFFTRPSPLWSDICALRLAVFVDELHVPVELEIDALDKTAIHWVAGVQHANNQTQVIGTLRLLVKNNTAKLGRVAVHAGYRRQGVGSQMIREAMQYAKQLAVSEIMLGAQTTITDFYETLGFKQRGEVFMDAGIVHIEMSLALE